MRKYTNLVLDLAEQGMVDKDVLIRDLLGWMSEADVEEFARRNEYVVDEEEEDPDVEECPYCGCHCDGECDEALAGGFQDEDECEYCSGEGYNATGKGYDGDGKTCSFCSPDWGSIGPPS